jgi:hypothetical protein
MTRQAYLSRLSHPVAKRSRDHAITRRGDRRRSP